MKDIVIEILVGKLPDWINTYFDKKGHFRKADTNFATDFKEERQKVIIGELEKLDI